MSQATIFEVDSATMNACARALDGHGHVLGADGIGVYCVLLSFMKGMRWVQIPLSTLQEVTQMREREIGHMLTELSIAKIISIKKVAGAPSIYSLARD